MNSAAPSAGEASSGLDRLVVLRTIEVHSVAQHRQRKLPATGRTDDHDGLALCPGGQTDPPQRPRCDSPGANATGSGEADRTIVAIRTADRTVATLPRRGTNEAGRQADLAAVPRGGPFPIGRRDGRRSRRCRIAGDPRVRGRGGHPGAERAYRRPRPQDTATARTRRPARAGRPPPRFRRPRCSGLRRSAL